MSSNVTEAAIWGVLNDLSWSYWSIPCLLAMWCLQGLYILPAVQSRLGIWIRISLYAGLLLIAGGFANTAFPSLGLPLVLLGLRGYIYQLRQSCLKDGRVGALRPEQPTLVGKLAASIVEAPR